MFIATIAEVTEGLTDGQFIGFGVLLVLAVYVTVYLLLIKARRDDRVDEAARGIARLHTTSPSDKLRVTFHGKPRHGESRPAPSAWGKP